MIDLTELARVPTPADALAGGAGSSVEAGSVAVPGVSGLSAARGGQPAVLAHAQVRLHALALKLLFFYDLIIERLYLKYKKNLYLYIFF